LPHIYAKGTRMKQNPQKEVKKIYEAGGFPRQRRQTIGFYTVLPSAACCKYYKLDIVP
jgi:hypothetical protein